MNWDKDTGESSVQLLSCVWLCDPMNCSTPGLPIHHQLPQFTQTHVHWVGDAIQPPHPLSSPSPPALNLSQHQGLFQWVGSSYQVTKVLEFQLLHQSFQWVFRTNSLGPRGLFSSWNSLGQNTGVGSLSLLQGIFPTQGSNPGLPQCRWILHQLSHKGSMERLSDPLREREGAAGKEGRVCLLGGRQEGGLGYFLQGTLSLLFK